MQKIVKHLRSLWSGALLSILFALTHLFRLDHHGFWIDELHTFGSIAGTFRELVANRLAAGHIPTYFILMQAWTWVAGISEWSLRFPSVLAASLAFFAFFLLVREFLPGTRAYVIALVLFFFHPFLLWASHDARMYALVAALSILAAHQLLRYLRDGRGTQLAGYAVVCAIGLSIHMLFLLQVAAHLVFTACHFGHRLKGYLAALVPPLAVLGPLALLTASRSTAYKPALRLRFPDVTLVIRKTSILVFTDFDQDLASAQPHFQALARGLSLAFFVWIVIMGIRKLRRTKEAGPEGDLLRFSFYWMGIPALLLLVSLVFNNTWVNAPRYYIPGLGAVVVVSALALDETARNRWGRLAGVVFAAFFALAIGVQLAWRGPGIREALQFVKRQSQPGDGIVFCHSGALTYAFALYGCEGYPMLPVDRKDHDAPALRKRVQDFAQGRRRLWIVLHNPQH
ncbi:MAG TPA: glycosyltransferase family 39 protein, partial [Holophaga sp.]|nr:glycosyltransferase family 39 protein [Holophaga sp.]